MSDAVQLLEQRLRSAFNPEQLTLQDDSAAHAGHAGARAGGGHFQVLIVSRAFVGQSLLARHRMVNQAVADLIPHVVHALSIKALTPEEA